MAGTYARIFIDEARAERLQQEREAMSNEFARQAAMDEETRRRQRSLMAGSFNDSANQLGWPKLDIGPAPKVDLATGRTIPSEPYKAPEPRIGTERTRQGDTVSDPVNKPAHYRGHASGIECIQITEHMGFNIGNAVKYLWRCDLKNDAIEDLEKSVWYIKREIEKRKKAAA